MESSSSSATRVLIVAHKTAATPALLAAVRDRAAQGPCRFTLLVPASAHGLHKVVDPEDTPDTEAREVIDLAVPLLDEAAGGHVEDLVGSPPADRGDGCHQPARLRRGHRLHPADPHLALAAAGPPAQDRRARTAGDDGDGEGPRAHRRGGVGHPARLPCSGARHGPPGRIGDARASCLDMPDHANKALPDLLERDHVPRSIPIRMLAVGVVSCAALAGVLGPASGTASAAYTAGVQGATLRIQGDAASDTLTLVASPTTLFVDVGQDGTVDFSFDRTTFTAIEVLAGGGDDAVRVDNSLVVGTPVPVTIDGGSGNDTLLGGAENDLLLGGPGDDFVDGNIGSDVARLGTGADRFEWDPGDGSDTVEGQDGRDTLDFNGSNVSEHIDVTANGPRVRLARDVAGITMDLDGVEALNVRALGGTDAVARRRPARDRDVHGRREPRRLRWRR